MIPDNSRAFPAVLLRAQSVLRTTFGMELVELRPKRKGDLVSGPTTDNQAATQVPAQPQRKRGRLAAIQEDSDEDAEEEGQAGTKKKGKSMSSYTAKRGASLTLQRATARNHTSYAQSSLATSSKRCPSRIHCLSGTTTRSQRIKLQIKARC